RGCRTRGSRHLLLLGHGRHRRRDTRPRLPERCDLALGQYGQQEVLPDRWNWERRNLGRFWAELLSSQRSVLRNMFELRTRLLPVQAEPRLSRRKIRRPIRTNHVQRLARRSCSGWKELYLYQPVGEYRTSVVACVSVLRGKSIPHSADDTDVVLREKQRCSLR